MGLTAEQERFWKHGKHCWHIKPESEGDWTTPAGHKHPLPNTMQCCKCPAEKKITN